MIVGSNSARWHGCLSLESARARARVCVCVCVCLCVCVCGCGVRQRSECDLEASIIGGPWPTSGCCAREGGIVLFTTYV